MTNKKSKREEDLSLLSLIKDDPCEGYDKLLERLKKSAFHEAAQIEMIEDKDLRWALCVYMGKYRLSQKPLRVLLDSRFYDPDLVSLAVSKSEDLPPFDMEPDSEVLLIKRYPQFVESYLENSKRGHLSKKAFVFASRESNLEDVLKKYPYPHFKPATTRLGDLLTPEQRRELGIED